MCIANLNTMVKTCLKFIARWDRVILVWYDWPHLVCSQMELFTLRGLVELRALLSLCPYTYRWEVSFFVFFLLFYIEFFIQKRRLKKKEAKQKTLKQNLHKPMSVRVFIWRRWRETSKRSNTFKTVHLLRHACARKQNAISWSYLYPTMCCYYSEKYSFQWCSGVEVPFLYWHLCL